MNATIRTSAIASARRLDAVVVRARAASLARPGASEREPLGASGGEQHQVGEARRIEVGEILPRERDVRALERLAVAGQLERAAVGGALPAPRRSSARSGSPASSRPTSTSSGEREVARRATRPERGPQHEHGDDGAGHREERPLDDVPVAPVAELVRDDRASAPRSAALARSVSQSDDAPRRPEPGDVRVRPRRPAARVGDEDVADGDAGPLGERAQRTGEALVLERAEAVEERLEDDGRDEREREDGERERRRPPAPATTTAQARASPTAATQAAAASAIPIASPFARSASQPPRDCVERPKRRSRTRPRQRSSGRQAASAARTTTAAQTAASPAQPEPSIRTVVRSEYTTTTRSKRGRGRGIQGAVVPGSPVPSS